MIGVFLAIEPGIGKKVGRDTVGNDLFDRAHPGTQLDYIAGHRAIQAGRYKLMKSVIYGPQVRFPLPGLSISLDLEVVLHDRQRFARIHVFD
jgi:hypothetical protein